MIELLEPIFPIFIVLVTLVAISGIVLITISAFRGWARHFYNLGFSDGMKAQALHDKLIKEESESEEKE